ncbi:hypothetical protein J6590_099132 [Homalodisca vitripennis]|nr:hypothetical protein J6590_099132 [Homalodisca vitripennis]
MAFRYTCARYGIRTLFAHKEVNVKVAGTVTVQRLNETAYESVKKQRNSLSPKKTFELLPEQQDIHDGKVGAFCQDP